MLSGRLKTQGSWSYLSWKPIGPYHQSYGIAIAVKQRGSLKSLITQRLDRIDAAGPERRQPDGDERHHGKDRRDAGEDQRVARADAEQQRGDEPRQAERRRETDGDAGQGQAHALQNNHLPDLTGPGAEG